ncbi:uncharacterized protein FRV6_02702 [Fusarium oxysporum]|uniref:Uncharacterized protein n=1 Tax=Fusarium oxysporum TaxID=5507 RepID=A0A2H3STG0_FUSOX|nr:uncharacterized protein FRV6_02702 [Fusarium oxysporum]
MFTAYKEEITLYGDPNHISGFSSYGPTAEGHIKLDVIAPGDRFWREQGPPLDVRDWNKYGNSTCGRLRCCLEGTSHQLRNITAECCFNQGSVGQWRRRLETSYYRTKLWAG